MYPNTQDATEVVPLTLNLQKPSHSFIQLVTPQVMLQICMQPGKRNVYMGLGSVTAPLCRKSFPQGKGKKKNLAVF